MPVYAKPLTLHRGVDNMIQFQFLNQEQKPVDITGKSITCRIISYDGSTVLLTKALDLVLSLNGIAALNLVAADIEDIPAQKCHYSLEIPVGEFDYPVFVDQNAGARGDMNIVNSILPYFVPSSSVTIPTGQPFPNQSSNSSTFYSYYSSVIDTSASPVLTIQAHYDQYNGNVTIQGSTQPDVDWYPILEDTYTDISDTIGYTVKGFHPFVRLAFSSNAGAVTNLLSR